MRTKNEIKFLTKLLNIEGIKVISHRQHEGIGIILQLEQIGKESSCPRCGTKSHRLHQNHRYLVKDVPWGENFVFLEINRRQFKCEKCSKPFSEELEFVRKRRSYTKRLARKIIQEVLENDIHSVAKKGVVTTEEIERMLKDAAKEYLKAKPSELKRLGIDEIAVIKGKGNYCAVLIDLEKSKLIGVLPGRKQEEIREVLLEWGKEVLEQIEEVSIDLWKGYKNVVIDLMPNAQVVADRFHVMAQINRELDAERKRERRQVEDLIRKAGSSEEKVEQERVLEGLKKSKYVLLKNETDLSEEQKTKLVQVKDVSPTLKLMHELKEKLRKIFEQTNNWLVGLFKLGRWLSGAKKYFPDSQNTIIRWLDEIIAYFDYKTTSGVVEGINNKLKLIKRSAYGFRNFENFRVRCLLTWQFNC
ncbi:ISL3 family transposase [Microcoleus vaginatus PCC 9802]|uniref:ISL3 family transposase n=1 Tax=Microcoleus vaginatus TaxID=119532 RepID=UPI00020D220B|nr:transposase IS204/IS1001/IS1096/IS1165 family protein [Microcoleus vaginatus FGP-2]UNU17750.1 ISL3 family transposase [Microcoleus vaginatus PCC 9802]